MTVISIFVSSTFRDFHVERDELVASVLPVLNEQVAEYGCRVEMIDLRWGVSAVEGDAEQARVLEVCLDEIDRARPLFLGLLGDRYGWVPDALRLANAAQEAGIVDCEPGISATALEFEYGALRRPARESVFLEREVVGPIPRGWCDVDTTRVRALKSEVRQHCDVYVYRVTSHDGLRTDSSEFVACAVRVLGEKVVDRARAIVGTAADPVAAAEALFFDDRLRAFDGRSGLVAECVGKIRSGTGVCLTGKSGVGKSAIWCAAVNALSATGVRVVAVPVGASPEVTSVRGVLLRICALMGADTPPSLSLVQLEEHTRAVLGAAAPVVVAVDGIDQLPGQPRPTFLAGLPSAVTILVSTTAPEQSRYAAAIGVTSVNVTDLETDDGRAAVRAICASMGRTLPSAAVDRLVAEARTPLWLRLGVGELSALNANDFSSVDPQADPLAEIARLVTDTVNRLPSDTGDLLAGIVDRAMERFGDSDVGATLSLTAVSRSGLRPDDFERLIGIDALTVAGIRRSLSGLLVPRGEGGRLGFTHDVVRGYITQRFVSDGTAADMHRILADHFLADEDSDALCQEDRLWHLLHSEGLSAGPVLNRVNADRHAGLAGVVLNSLSAPGVSESLRGLDPAGIHFLAAVVLDYKSTMRSPERIMLCTRIFAEAQKLGEGPGEVSEDVLRAIAAASSCLADLPSIRGVALGATAEKASEFTQRLVGRYPGSTEAREANALTAMFLARELGDDRALTASRVAVRDWQWVADRSPSLRVNAWLQFALIQCGAGELRKGNTETAHSLYERALPLTREVFEARGGSPRAAINIINALSGLASVAAAEENGDETLEYLREAVELAQAAYAEDPDRGATEGLARISSEYGMALADTGRRDESRRWLARSEELFLELAQVDPENTDWVFGLVAAASAAAADMALGQLGDAREHIRSAIEGAPDQAMALSAITQSLVQAARKLATRDDYSSAVAVAGEVIALSTDPSLDFAGHHSALANAFDIQSTAFDAMGAIDRATAAIREAIRLKSELVAKDPHNIDKLSELAFSQTRLSYMSFGTKESFEAAVATWRRLAAVEPNNLQWSRSLAIALGNLALLTSGEGALELRMAAITEFRKVIAANPNDRESRIMLNKALAQVAWVSPPEEASTMLTEAIRLSQYLVDTDPGDIAGRSALVGVLDGSAAMAANAGGTREAARLLLRAADVANVANVANGDPEFYRICHSVQRNLVKISIALMAVDPDLAVDCSERAAVLLGTATGRQVAPPVDRQGESKLESERISTSSETTLTPDLFTKAPSPLKRSLAADLAIMVPIWILIIAVELFVFLR